MGRAVSDIGSSIQMLILPLYIIDIGGTAATVGLATFLSIMPIIISYPFAGVIGDRVNRKHIMVAADGLSAVFILMLAFQSYRGDMSIPFLLAIQGIVALFYGFFDSATKGMIPEIVQEDKLAKTNSKVATLRILSGIVAPLFAVNLYTAYGITLLFFINGFSFLISASTETFINYTHIGKASKEGVKGVFHDMREGMRFIKNNMLIRRLSVFFLVVFALIHPVISVVLPLFFRTELQYSDSVYGYLQIVLLLGGLAGSIITGLSSKSGRVKRIFTIGIGAMPVAVLGFASMMLPRVVSVSEKGRISYLLFFGLMMFLLYTTIMFVNIPLQTIIQKETPKEFMSRVFSIVGLISKGGMPLGALIYGVVLERLSIHSTVMISGVIVLILSIHFMIKIKNMEDF